MNPLRISIYGISCLADPRKDAQGQPIDGFRKRVLLPTDTISDVHHPPHIPYVEIAEVDLDDDPSTVRGLSPRYSREGVVYRRFELSGHRVSIETLDVNQDWSVSPLYDFRVPKMKHVLPTLADSPKADCFLANPPASLIAGYFDITVGRLTTSDVDGEYTSFFPQHSWPHRRLARAAVLEVNVTSPTVRIEDASVPPVVTLIRLKADAAGISVGNLPVSDLSGCQTTDDPSHDFKMFYKLANPEPVNPPLPARPGGVNISCSNTNWP